MGRKHTYTYTYTCSPSFGNNFFPPVFSNYPLPLSLSLSLYIYIYIYVCVCLLLLLVAQDDRELIARLRPFARFHSAKEHEELIENLLLAKKMRYV